MSSSDLPLVSEMNREANSSDKNAKPAYRP